MGEEMKKSELAAQPPREPPVQGGEPANITERMNDLYNRVACRAFEIFDGKGRFNGGHLDEWFQAEMQFAHPVHIHISEFPEDFKISFNQLHQAKGGLS
jgi:hypothetical protein